MSTSPALAALPKGALILVTGASGFIGGHVVDQTLAHGFSVRGTVRSKEKGEAVAAVFKRLRPNAHFEYVIVEDMAAPNAFDEALSGGVAGVAHVASNMSFGGDPNKVVTPVLESVKTILAAAKKAGTVKRFVLTSSSVALVQAELQKTPVVITDKTWNTVAEKLAWQEPFTDDKGGVVYAASKTAGERYAREWVAKEQPGFVFNSVNPNYNSGKILDTTAFSMSSGALPYRLLQETPDEGLRERMKNFTPQFMVDVQDTAKLHVAALAEEDIQNDRLLGFTAPFNWNTVLGWAREAAPHLKLPENEAQQEEVAYTVDTRHSEDVLRRFGQDGYTPIVESFRRALSS